MRFIRFACLSMLILTLTLAATACDISDFVENPQSLTADSRSDPPVQRVENHASIPLASDPAVTRPPETTPPADGFPQRETALPVEQIEALVLEHAGIAAADVLSLWTEYDMEDRLPVYEVEFCAGDQEYEYTVHAETGEFLEFERDRCDHRTHRTP